MEEKNKKSKVLVRPAEPDDSEAILRLVCSLADYEKLPPPDTAAQARLIGDAFGGRKRFDTYLAEVGGEVIGYAFVFETYSTFLALPTLYLEDLYVLPEYRGSGAGYALFRHCVAEARTRGCGRMEWAVLDWNKLAHDFYERLGAGRLNDWQYYRLTKSDFDRILN